ncbi:HAD family hydrolase [Sinorhizobium americanum]|uniref:HAD family hydrolase n=1 Tax=Sinorhizobium americanum TaxID=194963 RepID=UPI00140551C1|nr:HAD-IIB family hydrolase [Sinorhizobium americanum]
MNNNNLAEYETDITGEKLRESGTIEVLPAQPFKIMCAQTELDPTGFDTLRQRFSLICEITASNSRLLEITPKGVSKGTAAAHLAASLNLDASRCAAVGDGESDLSLLRWAGMALSVANAIPEVKALAKFTGPSAEEGGLADVFDWLIAEKTSRPPI